MSRGGTRVGLIRQATPAEAAKTSGTMACRVVYDTSGRSDSGVARKPATSIQRLSATTTVMTAVRLAIRPLRPGAITVRRGA